MPISGSPEALPLSSLVALGAKAIRWVGGAVFGLAPAHPLAPHLERGGLHLLAHQLDHLLLGEPNWYSIASKVVRSSQAISMMRSSSSGSKLRIALAPCGGDHQLAARWGCAPAAAQDPDQPPAAAPPFAAGPRPSAGSPARPGLYRGTPARRRQRAAGFAQRSHRDGAAGGIRSNPCLWWRLLALAPPGSRCFPAPPHQPAQWLACCGGRSRPPAVFAASPPAPWHRALAIAVMWLLAKARPAHRCGATPSPRDAAAVRGTGSSAMRPWFRSRQSSSSSCSARSSSSSGMPASSRPPRSDPARLGYCPLEHRLDAVQQFGARPWPWQRVCLNASGIDSALVQISKSANSASCFRYQPQHRGGNHGKGKARIRPAKGTGPSAPISSSASSSTNPMIDGV